MLTPNRFRPLLLPLLLAACSQLDPAPAPTVETQAQTYAAQDLGTLGGTYGTAYAISDGGHVAGASSTPFRETHAFLWTEKAGMRDLGTLGGTFSRALGVNDSGMVVGEARTASDEQHAFSWTEAKGMRDLGTLGGRSSTAQDVNGEGMVVGYSATAAGTTRAFVWTEGAGLQDIGTLGGDFSVASGVNDHGVVVGHSRTAAGLLRSFAWTASEGMRDLGVEGTSYAAGISDQGAVVGSSPTRAFFWTAAGGSRELGTLGGKYSDAYGVNDSGVVVGDSHTASGVYRPFVWTAADGMRDLGTLGGAWGMAHGLNESGMIAGESRNAANQTRATLWSVAKTPQTITFDLSSFSKTFGDNPFVVSAFTSSGLAVSFASDTPAVCTVSGADVTLLAAGTCTLTASQAGDATYAAAKSVSQNVPVAKGAPLIGFGESPTVGERGSAVEVAVTSSSDAPITLSAAPETICTLKDKTLSLIALGDCTVTAAQPGTANFLAGSAAHVVKVVRTLTSTKLTAVSGSSVYGGAATLSATLTSASGVALTGKTVSFEVVVLPVSEVGSAVTDANGVATLSGVNLQGLGAGRHPVIADFAGDDTEGLAASHALGEVTVAQAAQSVSFSTTPPSPALVGGSYSVLAAASSGLPVALAADTAGVCTLSGSTIAFVGTGTCTLTASQAGSADVAAASARQSFAVAAPPPTPVADLYRLDFERAPANRLVYSVAFGSGMVRLSGDDTQVGTVPVVGKRRVGSGIDPAHLARVVSVYGSKRLVVASPNRNTPAPTGGRVKLSFTNIDPGGVTLTSLTLSNLTVKGAYLTFYYADGRSSQQNLGTTRAGTSLVVALNIPGLRAVDVFAPSAFAVDDATFVNAP